ncbi:hypothetical protein [Mycobacterium lepromatosis]
MHTGLDSRPVVAAIAVWVELPPNCTSTVATYVAVTAALAGVAVTGAVQYRWTFVVSVYYSVDNQHHYPGCASGRPGQGRRGSL